MSSQSREFHTFFCTVICCINNTYDFRGFLFFEIIFAKFRIVFAFFLQYISAKNAKYFRKNFCSLESLLVFMVDCLFVSKNVITAKSDPAHSSGTTHVTGPQERFINGQKCNELICLRKNVNFQNPKKMLFLNVII